MAITISNATAIAMCDAWRLLVDGGAGAGKVKIYTGTKPTNLDAAISDTLLCTFTLSDPSFGAAADINPGARSTALSMPKTATPVANGTAGWILITTSADAVINAGTVTATGGGGDATISSTSLSTAVAVDLTALTLSVLET